MVTIDAEIPIGISVLIDDDGGVIGIPIPRAFNVDVNINLVPKHFTASTPRSGHPDRLCLRT
jgi:hypothetical protein